MERTYVSWRDGLHVLAVVVGTVMIFLAGRLYTGRPLYSVGLLVGGAALDIGVLMSRTIELRRMQDTIKEQVLIIDEIMSETKEAGGYGYSGTQYDFADMRLREVKKEIGLIEQLDPALDQGLMDKIRRKLSRGNNS